MVVTPWMDHKEMPGPWWGIFKQNIWTPMTQLDHDGMAGLGSDNTAGSRWNTQAMVGHLDPNGTSRPQWHGQTKQGPSPTGAGGSYRGRGGEGCPPWCEVMASAWRWNGSPRRWWVRMQQWHRGCPHQGTTPPSPACRVETTG